MALTGRLRRARTCDGACCRATPLRPTDDGTDCAFRDPALPERGCRIMANRSLLATLSDAERAYFTEVGCEPWPANETPETCDLAVCCWEWVSDDADG